MLTHRQHELLKFIAGRIGETGVCPSFDEMKDALGLRSKSGIQQLLSGLEERGYISRLHGHARAIQVVLKPGGLVRHHSCPLCGQQLPQRELGEVA